MARLSIIIPSRDEKFLTPTIDDIFRNARGEIEVIVVLDSNSWPSDWKEVTDRHPNLHTIHNGQSIGMRGSINKGVASAISRGAKFIAKFDGHCSFSEGFDEVLKAECDTDWIVVPRRGRLDPENWCETELQKPPIDYHYLSFPNDPNDFGGPGLNGKVWLQRAIDRAQYDLDEEMSSQGSGWFMYADYFTRLELMDEANYGPFWNEFQELGNKCWLSGGRVMVNKKCKYLHLHKGTKYGRGYRLPEAWLQQGRAYANLWAYNEAWSKQTLPFKWLIEHFWPVPSWPDNWEEILYAQRKPRGIVGMFRKLEESDMVRVVQSGLKIHSAYYGVGCTDDINVRDHLQTLTKDSSLDIIVNNSTLTPGQNPFRGRKKTLFLDYSINGGELVRIARQEKDWLIIGPVKQEPSATVGPSAVVGPSGVRFPVEDEIESAKRRVSAGITEQDAENVMEEIDRRRKIQVLDNPPRTPTALNDYLIRRFQISPQRLRGPMPIEVPQFHRNDLAQLFAELGFKRGAEIGVAEGKFSEVILKANPEMNLLLVDPWHMYSDNPQNKSKEKHEFAFRETERRVAGYKNVEMIVKYSMDAVRHVEDESLDMVYLDAHHSYPFIMEDLINWTRKVRSGGIVALDDVYKLDEARWGAGPMEAIYDYTRAMRINPWWLINAHKSVDAFFVKP